MLDNRNGHPIHYTVEGEGFPIILIHGINASLHGWNSLRPELASAGFKVYALDLPGHGESHKPDDPEAYHAETFYCQFADWLTYLGLDHPPILVGHSLGGYLSMAYALRNPNQARGLVLIDPFYNPDQLQPLMRFLCWRPTIGERLLQLTPLWLLELAAQMDLTDALPYASQSMRRIALDYKRASTKVLYIPASLPDLTNKLGEINIPTLVIWGEKDLTLLPDSFPRLVRAMPGASGSVIRNSGHQPHISRPDEVLRLTLEFIAKL